MKNWLVVFLSIIVLFSCDSSKKSEEKSEGEEINYIEDAPIDLVNPFIGTGGHGHTYPGATLPFGMVQLSPDTRLDGWDGCSGYHDSDSIIYGFSHTHLSGTGVSDYGDVLLTPFNLDFIPAHQELMDHSKTKSSFDKSSEEAHPGYYAVKLKDFDIDVKLTATTRVGIHEYQFNNPNNRKIAINLNHRDKVLDCDFELLDNQTIVGSRISEAWATEQHVYFAIQFSEPFKLELASGQATVQDLFRVVVFEDGDQPIYAKVGLSAVSKEGAKKNMHYETTDKGWDFSKYIQNARNAWEKQLGKIKVKGTDRDQLINFYSALYHTMIAPNIFNDVDGHYRGRDLRVHYDLPEKNYYTVFSLWDTFRGLHPLMSLIERERNTEFIETFLHQYNHGGALPVWELAGNETGCMIGYHAVPVITDHASKGGNHDFNAKHALKAMVHSAEMDHLGLPAYREKGYIAAGDEAESVSKTLEYAYDDWCIAEFADGRDRKVYEKYIEHAQYYMNIFNPETGFMQAKMNGAFTSNFDPSEVNFNFTEANSWQYSMFVPQDIEGMIALYGGPEKFEQKLDELFSTEMELSGRHQVDITGLIGQYAHGNEPSHHMAYLYNYIGKPWKSQEKVEQILTEQYWNGPDGLSGNEDCGQMSAWYVLSAMGFYSVTPGSPELIIGSPLFDEITFTVYEKPFTIKAKGRSLSPENKYIQSATLNGKPYNKNHIHYMEFFEGGELVLEMGDKPNKEWASGSESIPNSSIPEEYHIVPVPYSTVAQQTFEESAEIELKSVCQDCEIYVSQNDSPYEKYTGPIKIEATTEFKYYGQKASKKSKVVTSKYTKIEGGRSVIYKTKYSNQYNAGGDLALVDYLKGSPNFRTGYWQGFQGEDVTIIVDLGEKFKPYKTVSVGLLQDIKSWIWYPDYMEIAIGSSPNGHFKESGRVANKFPKDSYGAFTQELKKTFPIELRSRYIKITLKYPGDVPKWHLGAGGKAWVFVDEVSVE